MRAVGLFTTEDFVDVIEPQVDHVVERHEKLRLLLELGERFEGFGEGGWGELTNGIRHTRFHKGAVVTDDGHIRNGLNLLKFALHGSVRTFRNHEYDVAVTWLHS